MADPGTPRSVTPEPVAPETFASETFAPETFAPETAPGGEAPPEWPPFPGERPLGADEPSAPYEEPVEPGTDPDDRPGAAAAGTEIRA